MHMTILKVVNGDPYIPIYCIYKRMQHDAF